MDRKEVTLFTDGAARGNPDGPGGYGAVLRYVDAKGQVHEREYSAGYQKTTNNRMELMAAIVLVLDICCIAFLYRTTIMVTMVLTTLSGIYLVLWLSTRLVYGRTAESGEGDSVLLEERSAGNRPGRAARLLEGLGLMSMDIYILHEPVVTVLKLVFWNRLGWNYILCTALFFILGVLIPIPVSRWLIRPVPLFRFLLFGELKGLKKSRAA
jgi:hypothetical protein